jgi:predicted dehydrogenase (TIGR03970 family)
VKRAFDVIVVGGGAAGAPLAARLSDAGRRVLVLEAGPAPRSLEEYPPDILDAGSLRAADPGHPQNWAFPAELAEGRPYSIARGRILGGSTAVNAGYFMRARRADFDQWEIVGGPEWSYDACLPGLRVLEADVQYGADAALHGAHGPMTVTRPSLGGAAHPATHAFSAAAAAAGIPYETDKNGEQRPGWGPLPMNVRGSVRWNTALAYLLPRRKRPELVVRGDATVQRVVIDRGRAVGVEVRTPDGIAVMQAGEIVLAAGGIQTPALLLRSGIGPAAALRSVGVEVVADSPGVGTGWSDHPQVSLEWLPRDDAHLGRRHRAPDGRSGDTIDGGPVVEGVLNLRSGSAEVEVLPLLKPTSELLGGDAAGGREAGTPPLALLVGLQNPEARGRIRLVSADPDVPVKIDYDYLSAERDRERMRAAVRLAGELATSAAFAEVAQTVLIEQEVLEDDGALDAWIRAHLGTALHLSGSARFGGVVDDGAVADPHGRVHGVTGLRIADLSLLPTVPSRGPANTAVLIGERLAALMESEA